MRPIRQRKRLALTLIFSVIIFCILFLTVLLAGITIMILVRTGLLLRPGGGNVNYLILYMAVINQRMLYEVHPSTAIQYKIL